MNIRLATPDDSEAVHKLITHMRNGSVDSENVDKHLRYLTEFENGCAVVAEIDGLVVGMLIINFVYKLDHIEARIDEVVVLPEAQGQGLGTSLMKFAETWAFEHGAAKIELTSHPSREAANHLYQKLGYEIRQTNVYVKKRRPMARVKLSEFAAKKLLDTDYVGVSVSSTEPMDALNSLASSSTYVVKVDQGVKKRGKQGLLDINIKPGDIKKSLDRLAEKGYSQFLIEPMLLHEQTSERYVSFERTRDGIVVLYSEHGGVDVEEHGDAIRSYSIDSAPLDAVWKEHVAEVMHREHISFLEINPLVMTENGYQLLDAAVLVDSVAPVADVHWKESDVVESRTKSDAELQIAELADTSTAAFTFRVLNPNGALWLLLSGGGASITIADEASNQQKAHLVGNYGEYSGGPTTEESYLYTRSVLDQALQSSAPRKALIIAGGVANFTDVKKTFAGVIRALAEREEELQKQGFRVFVRRGGPNEKEGLAHMKTYLEQSELYGSVHGSDAVLTVVVDEALEFIDA